MNILLDECVDRRLSRDLVGHSVTTVPRKGWSGVKNGELLALAAKEFDVFITVDRKLSEEQNLARFDIAVVLLRARSNRLRDLQPLVPELLQALQHVGSGALTLVPVAD